MKFITNTDKFILGLLAGWLSLGTVLLAFFIGETRAFIQTVLDTL